MTTPAATPGAPQGAASGEDAPRRTVSSLPRLTSEEVRNRGFKRATRGVSEAEVRNFLHRVAEELDASRAREHELEQRIAALEEELRNPPPVTEEQLLDALGVETARVLRSAQEAANEIRAKAESASASLLADAEKHAHERRDEAEAFVAERRREGQELATKLRDDAEARARELGAQAERHATEMRERAESEATARLDEALERGRSMVGEAKAVRERVLTDMARRRRSLQGQVAELRTGRDRLLEGYRVVRRTLSEATEALGGQALPEPELDLEALSSEEPEPADAALDAALAEVQGSVEGGEGDEHTGQVLDDADTSAAQTTADDETPPSGRGLREYVKGALGLGAEPVEVDEGDEVDVVESGEPAVPDDDGDDGAPAPKRDPKTVFAELRAETEGDPPATSADSGPAEVTETSDESEEVAPSEALTGDAALVAERDDAVAAAETALARAIKREVQDEQNELLDAIRRAKRRKDLSPLLADRDVVVGDWSDAIRDAVGDAYGADPPPSELVRELAATLVAPLHDRLVAAIADGGDADALTQRVGARYREWRNQELAAAVAEVVATAQSRAVFDSTPDGARLRWVASRPGKCPDCDDNALEPTPRGETFPTGQRFPPAHPGCRCLLALE